MKAYVVGVGMTKFEKPETRDWQYWDMAKEAGDKALADAGVGYEQVEQVPVGYCFQASTAGQRAAYELGLTGVPVYNVNNNCATGSTALMMARQFVEGGLNDCVLALGFEKMARGSLGGGGEGDFKTSPVARHYGIMAERHGFEMTPPTAQIFGNAAREHMERHGTTEAQLAAVGAKNHRHSTNNPYAQFQDAYTVDEVLAARTIHRPLTKLQCSPTSDGAAAAVVVSERFVERHGLAGRAVEIAAQAMTTDTAESFASGSCIDAVGQPMSREAARQVYETSG
ncbi:beta-ketoacyl synthase N-terminal-like domain-containing protein, partial [Streptomyces sp. NPDC005918]